MNELEKNDHESKSLTPSQIHLQKTVLRTSGHSKMTERDRIANAGLGLAGESGELIEAVHNLSIHSSRIADSIKKGLYPHPNSIEANYSYYSEEKLKKFIIEEMGDLFYYANWICHILGVTIEEVLDENIKKVNERFPS